jgi:NADPH:quinone reductase-like Zn-dependent oxidoreductase
MRAAQYKEYSTDLNTISLVENVTKPKCRQGFAIVKVNIASANPIDYLIMEGKLKENKWKMPFPFTMGYDFSGTIECLDERDKGKDLKVGDRVFGVNWGQHRHDTEDYPPGGAFAEFIGVPLNKLSKIPKDVSFELAAGLPLVGTCAYEGLFHNLNVDKGSRILILGGSTAVGYLAIQLAKSKGAWVATTCSTRTRDYVQKAKPDRIINYQEQQWENLDDLKDLDAIFDTVGEDKFFSRARENRVVKKDGRFATIVCSEDIGRKPDAHPPSPFASYFCFSQDRRIQDELINMIATNKLNLPIDRQFPFTEEGLHEMLRYQKSGDSMGKNLLKIGEMGASKA